MRKLLVLTVALGAAAFGGCGDEQAANNSLVSTTAEAAGDNCANGGLKFETGIDLNSNDVLDDDEILETEFICSGADGAGGDTGDSGRSTLLVATEEAAGANCANGGQRIDYGIDDNGDGILDAVEVDGTSFICDGDAGADGLQTLVVQSVVGAGATCPTGGIRVDSGVDTSGNGVLEAGEITSTSIVCNGSTGSDGLISLVTLTPEPAGANCVAGGTRVDSGLDTNGNGVLNAAEITDTDFVCNGSGTVPNGLGGFYTPNGTDEFVNAELACESEHGLGNCCNDGCGSCNDRGFHLCGSPNCNGSVYWNYDNDLQNMSCGWVDPNEILISTDGQTWTQ